MILDFNIYMVNEIQRKDIDKIYSSSDKVIRLGFFDIFSLCSVPWHTEAETKWLPFYKWWYFKCVFFKKRNDFGWNVFEPNRQQAIIWTNDGLF